MANLDKTGIATGEWITAAQIVALYNLLTGTTTYDNVSPKISVSLDLLNSIAIKGRNNADSAYDELFVYNTSDRVEWRTEQELGNSYWGLNPGIVNTNYLTISSASANGVSHGMVLAQIGGYNMITAQRDSDGAGDSDTPIITLGGALVVPEYTQYISIAAGTASVGATAPTSTTIGTARCLTFDADAELAFFEFEIPDDWNGTSDLTLKAYFTNQPGTAIGNGETVIFDFEYRSIEEGETIDNGSAVTVSGTYTQSGAGTDKEFIEGSVVLDYDHADQPLTAGDLVIIKANRDMTTDTYGSDINILKWEIAYTSNSFSLHN